MVLSYKKEGAGRSGSLDLDRVGNANRHNGATEASNNLKRNVHELQITLRNGQVNGHASKEAIGHDRIARVTVKERTAPAKIPIGGKVARHNKKKNLKLMFDLEIGTSYSISLQHVIQRISNAKLATMMGRQIDGGLMLEIFRNLDSRSFSPNVEVMMAARDRVMEVLNKNASAIWPNLWFSSELKVEVVTDAIAAKRRITRLFMNENELEETIDKLTNAVGFPGWLVIEICEGYLDLARAEVGRPLRAKNVLGYTIREGSKKPMSLISYMQGTAESMKAQREEKEAERRKVCSMGRIFERVTREPRAYAVEKGVAGSNYKTSGGSSIKFESYGLDGKCSYVYSAIAVFPGPLELVRAPTGRLYALMGGEPARLVALSPAEQMFLEPQYLRQVNEQSKTAMLTDRIIVMRREEPTAVEA